MFERYLERHIIIGDFICRSCGLFAVSRLLSVSRLLIPVPVGIRTYKLKTL